MRIVYTSFGGRYSDNPRAIHEGLLARGVDAEHLWMSDPDHEHGFPAGTELIDVADPACVSALEAADVVIANTHVELEWTKRPGALYLQTWHGTPLKRIHWDVLWAPDGRVAELDRDVARWDVLLSPNRASTGRLRGAFRFDGEVLETGYPRNDVLSSPRRDEVRARVRAQLGIADGTTAVLYTPTWRDDEYYRGSTALRLDVDAFTAALGADHVLLPRLHYNMTGRLGPLDGPAVRDVSYHPDVAELYLAADVMITDYSSTMVDFAVTGKPLLSFTDDLAHYRDELRGFYVDLVAEAPGPLLDTSEQVVDALRELPAVAAQHEDRYRLFRERYCSLEDGRATDRVIDRLAIGP